MNSLEKDYKFPKKRTAGLMVSSKLYPYYPPPVFGNWGKKSRGSNRIWINSRPEQSFQQGSFIGINYLRPAWKDVSLSNFDLIKRIKYLKIKNFKGIFSRNSKEHLHKKRMLYY